MAQGVAQRRSRGRGAGLRETPRHIGKAEPYRTANGGAVRTWDLRDAALLSSGKAEPCCTASGEAARTCRGSSAFHRFWISLLFRDVIDPFFTFEIRLVQLSRVFELVPWDKHSQLTAEDQMRLH